MELINIIALFKEIGVTMEDLDNFAMAYDILETPLVQEMLKHREAQVISRPPYTWTMEDTDMILNSLQNPETEVLHKDNNAFEPW